MSVIADYLKEHGDRVAAQYAQRVVALGGDVAGLHAMVPVLLASIADALREAEGAAGGGVTSGAPHVTPPRPAPGTDLLRAVQAYGVLRDGILAGLEESGIQPPMRELRIFSDVVSGMTEAVASAMTAELRSAARNERHHLLGLFDQAPAFMAYLNGPEHVFEMVNQAYSRLVDGRDVVGKTVREALPDLEGQGYYELLDEVYRTGVPFEGQKRQVALLPRASQGGPTSRAPLHLYLNFIYQPIRGEDGRTSGILVQGYEVTDLRQKEEERLEAEAALRASEERFRDLFAAIDDAYGVVEMDFAEDGRTPLDYRYVQVNAAFERHTGIVDAQGKSIRELLPHVDQSWLDYYAHVALTGESLRFENYSTPLARWFDVFASRVGPADQHRVAVVFKDITARRNLEKEREDLLLRERSAREAAESANIMKDEFLATLSHELRTPLNAMLGWLQMLRSGSLDGDRFHAALETVERNARAQQQLIEDLLDVSSILAGKLRLDLEPVRLKELVERAVESARPAAAQKGIVVDATLSPCDTVRADPRRMEQILANLLSNAVKFTPKGGRIWVLLDQHESEVEIIVTDTGKGITAEFLPRVFERFRQAEDGSTRSHGGLGLGLTIVRQLVEEHGGSVSAASQGAGRGATFTVRLPLVPANRASTRTLTDAAPASVQLSTTPELLGIEVVVVDDDADAGEMVGALLERSGAHVSVATSALEGFELVKRLRPGLLLSDIGMPEHDGYDLIGWVRALPEADGGRVPAVAVTAFARSADRTRALTSGFDNHVTKPIDTSELMLVIGSVLRRNTL